MDDNDPNAGNSDQGSNSGSSDLGGQNDQGSNQDQNQGDQGATGSQNGQQTDPRDAEIAQHKAEIKRLNRAIVEARRGNQRQSPRSPSGNGNQNGEQDGNAFGTPAEQYAASIQIATNELRGQMEDIFDLYPEIPQSELSRIRRNPWAFTSLKSYQSGDYQAGIVEIEQYLDQRVQELGKGNSNQNGQGGSKVPLARVPLNPPANPAPNADPGSGEDQDPWTMPMNKLEKQVAKEKQKMRAK